MSAADTPKTETASPSSSPSPPGSTYSPSPSPQLKAKSRAPKKRSSSSPGSPRKKPTLSPGKNRGGPAAGKSEPGGGNRKTGSWSKREVRQLFNAVALIPTTISWAAVADNVDGRDKLSCSNKWRYDLWPKIQAFVDSLGD